MKMKIEMRHIQSDLLNITQHAALSTYPYIGKGDKNNADKASTDTMRLLLNQMDIDGRIVIGEGEMDEAPMLFIGEKVGTGKGKTLDIAVDPIDGTTNVAAGDGDAVTVIAASDRGALLHAPDMYMKKIAVGPKVGPVIDIDKSLTFNMKAVANKLGKPLSDLHVMVQDRDRHKDLIQEIRSNGAKVTLFSDVDIIGAISPSLYREKVDLFVGIGGAPEGVIAATAIKCLGGDFQAQLILSSTAEYKRCLKMGITEPHRSLRINDIVRDGNCYFAMTGITNGRLLKGVHEEKGKLITHSLLIASRRSSDRPTYQFVESFHLKDEIKKVYFKQFIEEETK
ncbi:class II fructose-bisphosphatase [Terrilactibacillus laevilacticus]|uniref:Fructose-1,6-bisphosphatase n=1 Tax=Terrilactibacillus laevilacticus TaxID=1380157 RepID=A0ABW5PTA1_9BACI|nr:class II fructose-bisphosphatase [Terrilactibacillus laevilacticus]